MKLSCLALLALTLLSCAASAPEIRDVSDYRTYITRINENVQRADSESFDEGEQTHLLTVSGDILGHLEDVEVIDELNSDQQERLIVLNDQLHELMVGRDELRSSERICRTIPNTGSNIPNRVCRTRDQMTREREAARAMLRDRSDALDQIFRDERFAIPEHPFDRTDPDL